MSRAATAKITTNIFLIILSGGVLLWLLRGFGILTFMPGGMILFLLLSAIAVGILNLWQRRWLRF